MSGINIFYIDTIEQTVAAEESEYTINEYGKREKWTNISYEEVQAKFFKKCSDVSADLIGGSKEDAKHYYMSIRIIDEDENILKKDKLGTRQPVEIKPEPTPEPTEG